MPEASSAGAARYWYSSTPAGNGAVRARGRGYFSELDADAKEATLAGPSFVEIQNTMLFANVGQENDD
jgi:hypothetical protein